MSKRKAQIPHASTRASEIKHPTCSCGAPAGDSLCPYASEINGTEVDCGCCQDCQYKCARDI